MGGILIEEDLLVKYSIIDSKLPEGQKIHEFLMSRAKALAGRYIDFDKTPITFVLSDTDEPNAFFAPLFNPEKKPRRDDYKTIRYIRNPLPTPVICITRGLLEMVETLDQLDFILGHELTHWMMRMKGIRHNSKGEEGVADLHAVDLMYDAGGDPKQALVMSAKISAYAQKKKEDEEKREYRSRRDEEEEGVDWSSILDVHLSDSNRLAGIEASLTRLSHLIDERQPTAIDKSPLLERYHDPIEDFLDSQNYKSKKPLGKLKILVDCIDHISTVVAPEGYYAAKLASIAEDDPEEREYIKQRRRQELQEKIDEGYVDYFRGPVIRKHYQQKIAHLAEAIFEDVSEAREDKSNTNPPPAINTLDLNTYLQNRAYAHIEKYGYPKTSDANYRDASGILYSYFFMLFSEHSRRWDHRADKEAMPQSAALIDRDLVEVKGQVRDAQTFVDFRSAVEHFWHLKYVRHEIRSVGKDGAYAAKLDNLSGQSFYGSRSSSRDEPIYSTLALGAEVPWNRLVSFSKEDESSKAYVVDFLDRHYIEDFRITHNLPYIRVGRNQCFEVDVDSGFVTKAVPEYEIDFAVHRETVIGAYEYIRSYFDNEDEIIDRVCMDAIEIDDRDFKEFEKLKDTFERRTIASKKAYDLVSMFNALPQDDERERHWGHDDRVLQLIPERYKKNNPITGFSENGRSPVTESLFDYDNPIFEAHFGAGYKEHLMGRKKAQQQKMFEAAFTVLKKAADIWLETDPKVQSLKETTSALQQEVWNTPKENQEERKDKEKKLKRLNKNLNFLSAKSELAEQIIYNFLFSIFEKDTYWYHLNRLTLDQKRTLADFAAKDERGVILQIMSPGQYERFCDCLGILENQTAQVIAGDYRLNEPMQIVAQKYGYTPAHRREDFDAFIEQHKKGKYSREHKDYEWYLFMFDMLHHLERNSEIGLVVLLKGLNNIAEEDRSSNGQDSEEIVRARYMNYRKFVTDSSLLPLVTKAISDEENYRALSFETSVSAVDLMVSVKNQMSKILIKRKSDGWGNDEKKIVTPEHQAFLDLLDAKIKTLLRQAEVMALSDGDALSKMTRLYVLLCHKSEYYSSEQTRRSYVEAIDKEEGLFKSLSVLSEDEHFWPDDALEHIKAYVFAKNTFLDDKEFEDKILGSILDKVAALPSGRKKSECLYILLDKNMRAAYPETRERLFDIYAHDVSDRLGKDDGSSAYQRRLSVYLKALDSNERKTWDIAKDHGHRDGLLSNSISLADKYMVMRRVSDLIVSQEQTSRMLKEACQISLNSDDMLYSYLYGIGVDYLTARMDKDPDLARKFIRFLNSKGEKADCKSISHDIRASLEEEYKNYDSRLQEILKQADENKCKILYENFWSAPLEARAVIIARMLKCAVGNEAGQDAQTQYSWERVFDVVMDSIIRPDDESIEAKYARDIMHSYIKSRSDYERVLILSAMMVANRNIGSDAGNVGKALKLFLENMGPAEIKLGQAIASHPNTPESIRIELQHLKNSADMPARWTVYDWIRAEKIPEELWKHKYLGEVMGSASYYTSIALGEEEVLRILRPEAREKAAKGFKVIGLTVDDLRSKEGTSDLGYQELTYSVQEMVTQAGRMSEIETDHDLGQEQYETAKSLCDDVVLTSGDQSFTLKVMDWRAKGKNWIIMDRANGLTYNDLPEMTAEQIAYKKHFAKGYILFEMGNILSGGRFDHDRHGAQLSVDVSTHKAGLYDTGAMALNDPSADDQRLLGSILYQVMKAKMNGEDVVSAFGRITGQTISHMHREGQDVQYLVEVKKGILALGDFFKILDKDEVGGLLLNLDFASSLSGEVRDGMSQGMTIFEKAQWHGFMAIQSARADKDVRVQRNGHSVQETLDVERFDIIGDDRLKAAWFQTVFKAGNDDAPDGAGLLMGNIHTAYGETVHRGEARSCGL